MANDHHQEGGRKASSSSSSKKHRPTTALPPVPPAHPNLLQAAAQPPSLSSSVLEPQRGLNEWGAFGGHDSTSGFNPLIFRHNNSKDSATITTISETASADRPLTGRDLVEMDRLMRTDPVSFNPLQAISWARLEEDVGEKEGVVAPLTKGNGKAKARNDGECGRTRTAQSGGCRRESTTTHGLGGKACAGSREEQYATATASTINQTHRQLHHMEPTPSPARHMLQTFSTMDMAKSGFVPPQGTMQPQTGPATQLQAGSPTLLQQPPQGRQQRKHRHRHDSKSSTSPTMDAYQQQQQGYPPPFPPTPTHAAQHPYPAQAQYQLAYTTYAPSSSYPPQQTPHQQQGMGALLLCLAPSCQARFPSEAQLQSHYQAVHTHMTVPSHQQHGYSPSSAMDGQLQHACSWSSCNAAGFTSNNALVWHVKAEHLLLCPVPGCCDRVFVSRKTLDGHVRNREVV